MMCDFWLEVPRATETSKTQLKSLNHASHPHHHAKQPSGNPRMRKAADALAQDGHTVHVCTRSTHIGPLKQMLKFLSRPMDMGTNWRTSRRSQIHLFLSRLKRKLAEIMGMTKHAMCRSYETSMSRVAWPGNLTWS